MGTNSLNVRRVTRRRVLQWSATAAAGAYTPELRIPSLGVQQLAALGGSRLTPLSEFSYAQVQLAPVQATCSSSRRITSCFSA